MNAIWVSFFLVTFLIALFKFLLVSKSTIFAELIKVAFAAARRYLRMGWDTRFVDALPTALMKPLSGSSAP